MLNTMPPADLQAAHCPSRSVLDHVTSRWGTLILLVLQERTYRFSELRQRVGGVSEKMLAQTLRVLEQDGFVKRQAFAEVPPRVEYELTAMGREIAVHLANLGGWIEANLERVLVARQAQGEGANSP
jgi:DNA-binding HxlR family transcriptional regulator